MRKEDIEQYDNDRVPSWRHYREKRRGDEPCWKVEELRRNPRRGNSADYFPITFVLAWTAHHWVYGIHYGLRTFTRIVRMVWTRLPHLALI